MVKNIFAKLPDALLPWYAENKRQLPWRENRQPYRVWLSEIMLQQTRVEAVRGYFQRFLEALPTVEALADCPDDKLHKLWEGLGYYSRVRNLKKAAGVIMAEYGGVFPQAYEQVRKLPGIGDYTAGAVCSICYDLPTPAVDGNVLRIAARLTDDATPVDIPAYKKQVTAQLAEIYPEAAGDFTQALMELGATVCGPNKKPDCAACPCNTFCLGYARGTAESLPVRLPKREKRREEKTVFILSCNGRYALLRRENKDLLAGLWQFPDVSGKLSTQAALAKVEQMGLIPVQIHKEVEREHVFTHIIWQMRGVYVEVKAPNEGFAWLTEEQVASEAALPTAYRRFWEIR